MIELLNNIIVKDIYRTNKDVLSIEDINLYIKLYESQINKFKTLQSYYEGRHKILDKEVKSDIPNNKIVNEYPKYITDTQTGYFLGQPIAYSANDHTTTADDKLLKKLLEIFKLNDEQEENIEIAKTCSIKGVCYEIMWIDKDTNVRFKLIQPDEMFLVYDDTLEENVKFAVRFYDTVVDKEKIRHIYVYDDTTVKFYEGKSGSIVLVDEKEHNFKGVPVIQYENNKEHRGDFEPVLSLIDAYDSAQSNTLNDMDQFTDAYLVLVNMLGTESEDIDALKEKRTLLLDSDGDAKWLIKDINDSWVENYKNRLKADIHKFSFTPDMSDENFGANLSGVSLSYKLLGMEHLRANKERKFKKALQRRIELICDVLKITNQELEYTGIDIKFNNSLPQNILELTQIIQNLSPYLSTETLIEQLPFVESAKEEMDKKEKEEKDKNEEDYSKLESMLKFKSKNTDEKVVEEDEE